jgi:hypothetical protein
VIQAETKGPLLPFKGKGGARIYMRALEQRQVMIEQAMRSIVQEFKGTFRPPRMALMVLHHHGGYYNLRWRAAGNSACGQTFFELTTSDRGQHLLAALPRSATTLLLRFERQRLDLNLASSICQHELRRLRDYLAKLDALGVCELENPP